jgi:hypothetical protein
MTNFLVALAEEYRARGFDVAYQNFVYGADFLPLAANATDSRVVTIEHDSDFILCAQTQTVFTALTYVLNPNVLTQTMSESSQRAFQNQNAHLLNTYGTGQRPFLWPKPIVFEAKSAFTVQCTDLSGTVGGQNIRLSFIGVKAFLREL